MGSMITGLFGGGQSDGQAAQAAALQKATQNYQNYRPEAMQARLNLLSNASTGYQGANNALQTMYGGRSTASPLMQLIGGGQRHQGSPMANAPRMEPSPMAGQAPPQPQGSPVGQAIKSVLDPLGIF